MECPVCGRGVHEASEFCRYHEAAHAKLHEMFDNWQKAMGEIGWGEYLEALLEADGTGTWVLEVIEHIRTEVGS